MLSVNKAFLHNQTLESSEREQENDYQSLLTSSHGFNSEYGEFDESLSNLTYGDFEIKIERNEGECDSLDDSNLIKSDSEMQLETDSRVPHSALHTDDIKIERNEEECDSLDDSNLIKSDSEMQLETDSLVPHSALHTDYIKVERNEEECVVSNSNGYCHTKVKNDETAFSESEVFYPMKSEEDQNQETSTECKEMKQEIDKDIPFVTFGHTTNDGSSLVTHQEVSTEFNSSEQENSKEMIEAAVKVEGNYSAKTGNEINSSNSKGNGDLDQGLGIQLGDRTEKRPECNVSIPNDHLETAQTMLRNSVCKKTFPKYLGVLPHRGERQCKLLTILINHSHRTRQLKTHTAEKPCRSFNEIKNHFPNSQLGNNMRTQTGDKPYYTKYKCTVCDKAFTSNFDLTMHTRTHTGNKSDYKCTVCDKAFTSNFDLAMHRRTHTGNKPYYKCTVCGKAFTSNFDLTMHTRTRTRKCTVCDKAFTSNCDLTIHTRTHTGNKSDFKCTVCDKALTSNFDLAMHMRTHTENKPYYKCTVCDKAFTSNFYLTMHTRTHTGNKPDYKCTVCNTLLMRTHTGEKPYKCIVCEKAVTSNSNAHLTLNMRIPTGDKTYLKCTVCDAKLPMAHTGEKPYKCILCEKSLTSNAHLTLDLRTPTGDKTYFKCTVCDAQLLMAPRGKKPYKCTVCEEAFIGNSSFTMPMRTCTGDEAYYKCTICDKAYVQNSLLILHMSSHNGEKPYGCTICEKAFVSTSHLRIHMRTHIGEKKL